MLAKGFAEHNCKGGEKMGSMGMTEVRSIMYAMYLPTSVRYLGTLHMVVGYPKTLLYRIAENCVYRYIPK